MAKPTSSRAKVSNTLDVRRSRGREVFDPESAAKQRQKQRRGVDISLFVDEKLQQNFIDITKDLSEKKAESLAASITKEDQQIREQQLALAAEGLDKRAELLSYYYEEVTKLFYRGSAASTDEIRREFLPALNAIRQDLAKSGLNLKEAKPILDIIKKAQTSFEERIAPAGRVVAKAKSILGSDFAQAALAGAATASPLVALAVFAFNARARKKRQVEIDQELRQQAIERQRRQPKKAAPNKAFTGPDKADVQQSRLQRRLARSKNRSTPKPKPKPQPDPSGDTPTILGPDGNPIAGPTTPTATPVILSPSGSVASGEPPIAGPTASRLIVDPSANPVGSGLLVGADGRPLAPPVIGAPRDTLSSSPLLTASGQPVDAPTATPVILSPSGSVASGEPPIAGPTASRVILGPDGQPLTNEPKPSAPPEEVAAPPEEVGKTRTRGARSDAVGMVQESSTLTEILTVLTSHTGLLQQLVGISAKQLKLKQREEEQRAQASEETLSETRDGILSDNGGSTDTRTDDDEKKDGLFGKLGNLARLIPGARGAGGAASSATGMVSRGGGMLARGGGMLARGAGMLLPGLVGGAGSAAAATGGAAAATGAAAGAGAAAGGGLMAALGGLASAVAAVAGPLLLIAAALVVAYKVFKKIDFSAVMEPLAKGFKILWSVVETVGKILYKMLIIPLKIVWAVLSKLADLISFALQPAFDALAMIMKPVIDGISFMWFEVFKPMTDGLLKFADKFESFIDWIINTEPKDIFNAMIDAITSTFKNMVAALMDGFSGLPIVGKYFKQAATALRSSGGAPDNKGGGGGGAAPSAGGGGGGAAPSAGGGGGGAAPSAGGGGGGAAPSAGGGAPALPAPGSSSSSASRSSVSFSGDGSDPKQVLEFGGESGQLQNFLGLHPVIQNKVILAGQEYLQKTGKKLKVNSAKRDSAKQQELWDESVKAGRPGRGPSGMAIAKPGRSRHERGLAIDIQNYKDPVAVAALNKQGLFQGVPGDPVHFQLDSNPSLDQPVSRAETATAAAGAPAPAAGASTTASTASPAAATPAAPSALPAPGAVSSTAGLSTDTAQGARMELTPSLQAPALPPPQAGGNINMIDASSSSVSGGGGGPTQDRLPAPIDMEPVIRRVITAT